MNRIQRIGAMMSKAIAAGALMVSAGMVHAGFVAIGSDQVLDTTTNLIWLKSWNAGAGSSFDNGHSTTDGKMTWANASSWAASLTTGGVAAGTWRLPTGDGLQSAGSANEFLQLWNDVGNSLAGLQAQFSDVQAHYYFSESEYAPLPNLRWTFLTSDPFNSLPDGFQSLQSQANEFLAVAVRSGDGVSAAPEPESLVLVLVGLAAAGVARRRRPR